MWLFILMWCAIIASVPVHHNTMEAFAMPNTKRLPDIFWNTSNPIFRIDNTDHIIDVNQEHTGNPFDYDRINIVCPVYDQNLVPDIKDTERFVIYHVTKEEYDTCMIRSHNPRIIAQCNSPYRRQIQTISFRSFTPMPGALEYKPGKDYHFISTSSKDDLHLRIGGMCLHNNMKIVFKVGLRHQQKLSDTSSSETKDSSLNKIETDDDSKQGEDDKLPASGLLPKNENDAKSTSRGGGRGKKHRRKNGDRKKKRRKGHKKKNHNIDQNSEYRGYNDIGDTKDSCPPEGCSLNVIENRNGFDNSMNKKFRNKYYSEKDFAVRGRDERHPYEDMPSRDEKLMNDKPRGILRDGRSDVAKVHDLMRHEPSISASSSASKPAFFLTKILSEIYTIGFGALIFTFL